MKLKIVEIDVRACVRACVCARVCVCEGAGAHGCGGRWCVGHGVGMRVCADASAFPHMQGTMVSNVCNVPPHMVSGAPVHVRSAASLAAERRTRQNYTTRFHAGRG